MYKSNFATTFSKHPYSSLMNFTIYNRNKQYSLIMLMPDYKAPNAALRFMFELFTGKHN